MDWKIVPGKSNVAKKVASLELDLKWLERDAERFGQDIKVLRAEKDESKTKSEKISKVERQKNKSRPKSDCWTNS